MSDQKDTGAAALRRHHLREAILAGGRVTVLSDAEVIMHCPDSRSADYLPDAGFELVEQVNAFESRWRRASAPKSDPSTADTMIPVAEDPDTAKTVRSKATRR